MKPAAALLESGLLQERLFAVLRAHRLLMAVVLVYWLGATGVTAYYGLSDRLQVGTYIWSVPVAVAVCLFFFALAYVVYIMVMVRPERLIAYIGSEIGGKWLTFERMTGAVIVIVFFQFFFSIFTSLKSMIPAINPFSWDPALAEWDRVLHGGADPWLLLHGLIGFPAATVVIDFIYQTWLALLCAFMVWQAFCVRRQALRLQFFLAFMLCWSLIGSLAATLLSSAGPVYFGAVTGLESPFTPLIDYLYQVKEVHPIWTTDLHERLWSAYLASSDGLGNGISAMPSMHVSIAMLYALVSWNTNRKLGWVLVGYTAMVMIGSVHLAWHYALDGYLALVMTYLLWRFAGWCVARDQVQNAPELSTANP